MEHERIDVGAHLRDQERHSVRHESGDEMNVSPEATQLRHDCRCLEGRAWASAAASWGADLGRRGLAGFDLDILGGDGRTLLAGEGLDRGAPSLNAQPLSGGSRRCALVRRRWHPRAAITVQ
jgi:hypothetical protein